MTPAEMLRAAKAKIGEPDSWCMGSEAVNASDEAEDPTDPEACRWCSIGAVIAVGGIGSPYVFTLLDDAAKAMGKGGKLGLRAAALLNDTTDHATVMKMFDRAIELAEAAS
jgi:hypothetical protein